MASFEGAQSSQSSSIQTMEKQLQRNLELADAAKQTYTRKLEEIKRGQQQLSEMQAEFESRVTTGERQLEKRVRDCDSREASLKGRETELKRREDVLAQREEDVSASEEVP